MKVIVKPTVNTLMLKYNKKCKSLVIVTSHGQTLVLFYFYMYTCVYLFIGVLRKPTVANHLSS